MTALASSRGMSLAIVRCQYQNGVSRRLLVGLIAAATLLMHFSSDAQARGRKPSNGRNRQAAAAAAARKQQMIKATQQEIDVARQVLGSAESQAGMSQAQVAQAVEKLSGIREAIKTAGSDVQDAAKALHEVEAEIMAEQEADSDVMRAQADLDQAKAALPQIVHRVLRLPNDAGKMKVTGRLGEMAPLSAEDRETLEQDADYRNAQNDVKAAARKLHQARHILFQADSDWVAAHREWAEAEARSREGSQQAQTAGLSSLGDRQDLRKAQNVAAAARAIIAQGEARLRELGARPTTTQGKPANKPNKTK